MAHSKLYYVINNYRPTLCEISWNKTQQCSSEAWTLGGQPTLLSPQSKLCRGQSLPAPHDLRHCVDGAHWGISSSTMKLVSATIGSATCGSASSMTLVSAMTGSLSPIFSSVRDSLGLRDDKKNVVTLGIFVVNIWDFFSASTVFFRFLAPLK